MGVLLIEEHVCDFCGKKIEDGQAIVGKLNTRRPGQRGLGKQSQLSFHQGCVNKLTAHANPLSHEQNGKASK